MTWMTQLYRLGVPPSAYEELRSLLAGIASLADCCDSGHALALTREVFTGTWFRLDRSAPLVATAAGVRPGDPLADLFFAVSFSAYISAVQAALVAKQLHTPLAAGCSDPPWEAPAPPTVLGPASWADDFVAMHAAPDGPSLIARVQAATSVFLTHATANGIQLAFGPEKTAALLPPAVAFDAHPEIHKQGSTSWLEVADGITGAVQCLPLVQAYKHLGPLSLRFTTATPKRRGASGRFVARCLGTPVFPFPRGDTFFDPSLYLSSFSVLPLLSCTSKGTGDCGHAFMLHCGVHCSPELIPRTVHILLQCCTLHRLCRLPWLLRVLVQGCYCGF